MKSLSGHTDPTYKLPTLLHCRTHIREIFRPDWLIEFLPYRWIPYISCKCCYFQFSKSWLHPNPPYDLLHEHVGLVLIFLKDCLRMCLCSWSCTVNGLHVSLTAAATRKENAIAAMCCLLQISYRSSSHE